MKNENPLVSIIVAVYNVGKYIGKCCESLFSQTYGNIEIVFVDDGTPDDSIKIVEALLDGKYAHMKSRVKIVHQENQGVHVARRTGYEHTTGDYVIHCDPDDWVSRRYIEKLVAAAVKNEADIVICNYYNVYRYWKVLRREKYFPDKMQILRALISHHHVRAYLVNKLVRRRLYEGVFFPRNPYCEDMVLTTQFLLGAEKVCYIKDRLYYYRKDNVLSLCKMPKSIRNRIVFFNLVDLWDFLEKKGDNPLECMRGEYMEQLAWLVFGSHSTSVFNTRPDILDEVRALSPDPSRSLPLSKQERLKQMIAEYDRRGKSGLRIAYCIHSLHNSGGMERVLTLKANALAERPGCEVHVIAASLRGRKPCFPLSPEVHLHDLGVREHLRPRLFRRKLSAVLKEIRPDVTISLSGRELRFLPSIGDGSAKVAEFHFPREKFFYKYGHLPFGKAYAAFRTRRLERMVSRLDGFVVLTKKDCEDWRTRIAFTEQIYNPVTFTSEEKSPLEEKRCIAVGRLNYEKNFSDLVKAWKSVAQECPDWRLDIFGDGPLRERLSKEIAAAGLDGIVRLMGRTQDIRRELLGSSLLVMTSRYEGFPMTLLEAAEAGLPLVSFSCPKGPAEIVRDGENGYLVTPGDTDALAQRIVAVIQDASLRKEMGRKAAQTAAAFSLDKIIPQWIRLLEKITGSSSQR